MDMTKTLRERYPSIFLDTNGRSALDYGISCGEGWFPLLDTLSALIVARATERGRKVQVLQVKEKFAGLRFYLRGHDPHIGGLVDAAEDLSLRYCEQCGLPGRLYSGGWQRILCREHFDEANQGVMLREGFELDEDGLPDYDKAEAADGVRFRTYKGEPENEVAERREGFDCMMKALQARIDPDTGGLKA